MFLFLILTAVFGAITWYYFKFNEILESVSHIPGPKPLPLVGHALMYLGKNSSEIHLINKKLREKYGMFFKVLLGPKVLIDIGDPKEVEALLIDQKILDKSEEYDITSSWIGRGILTASKEKWGPRRKITLPGFHFRCLQEFVKVFERNSEVLVKKMNQMTDKSINILQLMQLCALDNICGESHYILILCFSFFKFFFLLIKHPTETALGTKIDAQMNSDSTYVKAVETYMCGIKFEDIFIHL